MEDIVAVKVIDTAGKPHYFVTWGRIFDSGAPELLLQAITPHLPTFGIKSFDSINLCPSLREAANQSYFYEALFAFSQKHIPFGENYEAWRQQQVQRVRAGKEIYYLGTD
jgi:hypothetical protein